MAALEWISSALTYDYSMSRDSQELLHYLPVPKYLVATSLCRKSKLLTKFISVPLARSHTVLFGYTKTDI